MSGSGKRFSHMGKCKGLSKKYPKHRDAWSKMVRRCYDDSHPAYPRYGGRGIKVCDRWFNSLENFVSDMGERPDGSSLDRINNDGDYEPNNCRWADHTTQNCNTRGNHYVFIRGIKMTISQALRLEGCQISSRRTVLRRLRSGMSADAVFFTKRASSGVPKFKTSLDGSAI